MGRLIWAAQRATVWSYVDGADVAYRGSSPAGPGFWSPPTVLLAHDGVERHWREGIFGPVVSVLPFDTEEGAVRLANDTPYGLSRSIWARDGGRGLRVARAGGTGTRRGNSHSSVRYWTPVGGMKQSRP